jgi:peroxiredoxin
MAETSTTLKLNDLAPDFALDAANTSATYKLSEFLKQGPIVLEFLRGTW